MLSALSAIAVTISGIQAALFLDPEVPLAPASWAIISVCIWLLFVLSKGGWSQLSANEARRFTFGIFAAVSFLQFLQLDTQFKGWSSVYYFCGSKLQYCTCNFRWNLLGWLKAVVLWQFVLSATLGAQQLIIQAGLGGLLPGEEAVTRESVISIGWRLIPFWLNNWEQKWGAEVSSMTFELPHFAVELLIILPCCQIICSRLKVLVTPQVNVLLGPGPGPGGGGGGGGGGEEGPFVREDFAPNVLQGFWERRPEQRRFLPRVRSNLRVLVFLTGLTALAALNASLMPLYLEGQAAGAPSTPGVVLIGRHEAWLDPRVGDLVPGVVANATEVERPLLLDAQDRYGMYGKLGCKDREPYARSVVKHAAELQRMQDPEHRALIPLVETALAIMRLSCEKYFVLVAIYVTFLLFRDPPRPARVVIRLVARVSGIFQKVILFAFPVVCWLYNAGVIFSVFVSVVFWGGPLLALYDTARSALREVRIRSLSPATPEQIHRMGGSCAICWGDMGVLGAAGGDTAAGGENGTSTAPMAAAAAAAAAAADGDMNVAENASVISFGSASSEWDSSADRSADEALAVAGAAADAEVTEATEAAEASPPQTLPSEPDGDGEVPRLLPLSGRHERRRKRQEEKQLLRQQRKQQQAHGKVKDKMQLPGQDVEQSKPSDVRHRQEEPETGATCTATAVAAAAAAASATGTKCRALEAEAVRDSDGIGGPSASSSSSCSARVAQHRGDAAVTPPPASAYPDDGIAVAHDADGNATAATGSSGGGGGGVSQDAELRESNGEMGAPDGGEDVAAAAAAIPPPPQPPPRTDSSGSPPSAGTAEISGDVDAKSAGWALPCGHSYHHDCLLQWMEQCSSTGVTPTCPMCQRGIQLQVHWRLPRFLRRSNGVAGGNGTAARPFGGAGGAGGAAAAAAAAGGGRFAAAPRGGAPAGGGGAAAAAGGGAFADFAGGEELLAAMRNFAGHDAGLQVVGLLEHQRELQELLNEAPMLEFGEMLREAQPLIVQRAAEAQAEQQHPQPVQVQIQDQQQQQEEEDVAGQQHQQQQQEQHEQRHWLWALEPGPGLGWGQEDGEGSRPEHAHHVLESPEPESGSGSEPALGAEIAGLAVGDEDAAEGTRLQLESAVRATARGVTGVEMPPGNDRVAAAAAPAAAAEGRSLEVSGGSGCTTTAPVGPPAVTDAAVAAAARTQPVLQPSPALLQPSHGASAAPASTWLSSEEAAGWKRSSDPRVITNDQGAAIGSCSGSGIRGSRSADGPAEGAVGSRSSRGGVCPSPVAAAAAAAASQLEGPGVEVAPRHVEVKDEGSDKALGTRRPGSSCRRSSSSSNSDNTVLRSRVGQQQQQQQQQQQGGDAAGAGDDGGDSGGSGNAVPDLTAEASAASAGAGATSPGGPTPAAGADDARPHNKLPRRRFLLWGRRTHQ